MTEILPIKAWRYHPRLSKEISSLVSPLFDVISPAQRKVFYKNPFNSIHLYSPQFTQKGHAKRTLDTWKKENILLQDRIPGIYVHYQYFRIPGQEAIRCRKGFIAQVKAYDWEDRVIIRHEKTNSNSVQDQVLLLQETLLQASPTHGLYEDTSFHLEQFMDQAIENPIYDFEDSQGVREVLGVIHDVKIIHQFIHHLRSKQIFLADGHHRLEASIAYKKECIKKNPNHTGKEAYNYHLMYLTNAFADELKILPIHRLFKNLPISEAEILRKAEKYFSIEPLTNTKKTKEFIPQRKGAFTLIFKDSAYKITLKPTIIETTSGIPSRLIKELDIAVLHYFFIEKVLHIPLEKQHHSGSIDYERNLAQCHRKVKNKDAQFAIITKEIHISEVLKWCKAGYILPQKSTYFYPKTLAGLIFGSISEIDFKFPYQVFT